VASMGGKLLVDPFAAALIFLAKGSESLNQRHFWLDGIMEEYNLSSDMCKHL